MAVSRLALFYWVRLSLVSPPLVDNEPFSFLIDKRTCLSPRRRD